MLITMAVPTVVGLIVCLLTDFALAQTSETLLSGVDGTISCTVTEGEIIGWVEGATRLYTLQADGDVIKSPDETDDNKYDNFIIKHDGPTQFDLVIESFSFNDIGTYKCQRVVEGTNIEDVTVNLETVSSKLPDIMYNGNSVTSMTVNNSDQYDFTCNVATLYPGSLKLSWNGVDDADTSSTPNGDYYDLSSSYMLYASKGVTELTCRVNGYVNSIDSNLISSTVVLTVQYKPECTLVASRKPGADDDCTQVVLNCECDAVPEVTDYQYYYSNGTAITGNAGSIEVTVDLETTTSFYCIATNDVGSSNQVAVENPYICTTSTTKTMTTTKATSGDEGGSSVGAIVGGIIGGLFFCVIVGVGGYFLWKKTHDPKPPKKKPGKNDYPNDNDSAPMYSEVNRKPRDSSHDGNSSPVAPTMTYSDVNLKPSVSERQSVNEPKPAPRTVQSDPNHKEELQYTTVDHGNKPASDVIHQPEDPTQYATVGGSGSIMV